MGGAAIKFYVRLAADDPKADPYSQEVLVSPGVIALWELNGPGDRADRTVDSLSKDRSMVTFGWLIWAALGKPNDSFEAFLTRLLDFDLEETEVKPNPKARSTK